MKPEKKCQRHIKGREKPWLSKLMKERMKGENNPAKRPEVREKISIAQRGEKHHFYGKKRPEHSKRMQGKNNPFYGKGFVQSGKNNPFYGEKHDAETKKLMSKIRADFFRKNPRKHPNWILSHKERHGKGGISKPQRKLFNLLSKISDVELEYPIRTFESTRYADIALLPFRIDIEYDGDYWHNGRESEDIHRDEELLEVGWFTVRIDDGGETHFLR